MASVVGLASAIAGLGAHLKISSQKRAERDVDLPHKHVTSFEIIPGVEVAMQVQDHPMQSKYGIPRPGDAVNHPRKDNRIKIRESYAKSLGYDKVPFAHRNLPSKFMKNVNIDRWDRVDFKAMEDFDMLKDLRREAYDADRDDDGIPYVPARRPDLVLPARLAKPQLVPWVGGR